MFQMTGPITVQPFHRKRLRSSRGSRSSNIDRIDRNTLDPRILHSTSDLQGRVVGSQRTHQVEAGIEPSGHTTGGDNTHTAQRHGSTPSDRLAATRVTPCVATLASNRLPTGMSGVGALGSAWWLTRLLDDVPRIVSDACQRNSDSTYGLSSGFSPKSKRALLTT